MATRKTRKPTTSTARTPSRIETFEARVRETSVDGEVVYKAFTSHGAREITSPTQLRDACERAQVLSAVGGVLGEVDPEREGSPDLPALLGDEGDGILDGNRLTREEFSLDGKRARVCTLYLWRMGGEEHGALFLSGERELLCTMRGGAFEALPRRLGEELWDAHRTWPEEPRTPAKKPAKAAAKAPAEAAVKAPAKAARRPAEAAGPVAFKALTAASKKQFTSRVTGQTLVRCGMRVIRSPAQLTAPVEREQVLNGVAAVLRAVLSRVFPGWSSGHGLRKIFSDGDSALLDEPKVTREDFALAGSTRPVCTLYSWYLGDNEHGALFLPETVEAFCLMHDGDLGGPRTVGKAIEAARSGP